MEVMENQGSLIWTKSQLTQTMKKKFAVGVHKLTILDHVHIIVEVIVIVVMRNGTMPMISQQMPVEEMEAMVEMEGMKDQLEYFPSVEHLN